MTSLRTCKVRDAVFWYALVLAFLCLALPPLRYLLYTVPFLVILTVLGDQESRLGDEAKPFLVYCLAGIVFYPLATGEGIKDIFFVFSGVSIALLIDIPKLKTWNMFWLNVFSMVLFFSLFGIFAQVSNSTSPLPNPLSKEASDSYLGCWQLSHSLSVATGYSFYA